MRKNIFDLMAEDIDIKEETKKIYNLFTNAKLIQVRKTRNHNYSSFSYKELCDTYLYLWDYRGTYVSLTDIENRIGLNKTRKKDQADSLLLYCELILNMRKLIETKINSMCFGIIFNDSLLMGNIGVILEKLNYKVLEEKEDRVLLIKNNIDSELTASVVEEEDASMDILKYNDIRIRNNIKEKGIILFNIYKYYEGKKKIIKQNNSKVCNLIDNLYNNLNIRHNNETGYNENDVYKELNNNEVIEMYDNLYLLIIHAIRIPVINDLTNILSKQYDEKKI